MLEEGLFSIKYKDSTTSPYISALERNTDTIVEIRVPQAPGGHAHILAVIFAKHDINNNLVPRHTHVLGLTTQTISQVPCQCAARLVVVAVWVLPL